MSCEEHTVRTEELKPYKKVGSSRCRGECEQFKVPAPSGGGMITKLLGLLKDLSPTCRVPRTVVLNYSCVVLGLDWPRELGTSHGGLAKLS